MKKFTIKMNRGIALGLALLIGLSLYLTYDTMAFNRREADVIHEMITTFLSSIEQLHVDMNAAVLPREKQLVTADFLSTHFTNFRPPGYHHQRPSTLQMAQNSLRQFSEPHFQGVVDSVNFTLLEISSIQKRSTHAASVTFDMRISGYGMPWNHYFSGVGLGIADPMHGHESLRNILTAQGGDTMAMFDPGILRDAEVEPMEFENEYRVTAWLIREGGTWRWGNIDMWPATLVRGQMHVSVQRVG